MSWRWLVVGLVFVVALAAYLGTGIVVVEPGEAVVVRRLGKVLPQPWQQGFHWGWPVGWDRVDRVRIDEVRRLSVGLARVPGADQDPASGEFLTGDLNLLRAEVVVQYRIADPIAFVLRSEDPERLLTRFVESSLTRALSRRGVDTVLRADRALVAQDTATNLAEAVERHDLGIAILGVSLIEARPPSEVQSAFSAAQSARSDADRRIQEAQTYTTTTLSEANAEAQARLDLAHSQADRAVSLARSRADRFRLLLTEANEAPGLTYRRIYLDALGELLPKVRRKLVLNTDEPIDLSIFE